jgi:hypothetical protein
MALIAIDSSALLQGGMDPFTVYNPGTSEIVLRIPPRPAALSRYAAASGLTKTAGKMVENSDIWYYTIRSSTDNSPQLNDVMVGYNATKRSFAVPPTFDNESVVVIDEAGNDAGHYFSPEITLGGGKTYRLRFYNDDKQRTTFTFSAQPSAFVPSGTRVTFVDAVTGNELGAGSSDCKITVAAASHQDVFMVVGTRQYQTQIGVGNPDAKFKVGAVIVNSSARSARIRYYIPFAGVDRVEVSVYDIKGRMAWKDMQNVRPSTWNTTEWRSRESRRGAAAAGLYIIRVRAIDARGKTVAVENRRITFAR